MKLLSRTVLALLLLTAAVGAAIPTEPDFSFRWNRFTSVTVIDSFVVGGGKSGLMVFQRSSADLSLTERTSVFLNSSPIIQRRFGSTLVVQTMLGLLYFYDLSTLPTLTPLGHIDLGVSFNDLVLRGSELYVSRGFDGLFRYRLNGYNAAQLLDSSILGIHYLGLQMSGDSLLALDDYNGVLIYRFSDTGFARFQDYLYLPFQVSSFLKQDSLLILALNSNRAYVARLRPDTIALIDTFDLLTSPRRIMSSGRTFLLFDSSATLVEAISPLDGRRGLAQLQVRPDAALQGEVCQVGSKSYVLLPLRDGGIGFYDIDSLWGFTARPIQGLTQLGQLTALKIVNGKMFLGADKSPASEYRFGPDGSPLFERTLYSALDNVTGMDASGDSLFISYPQIRRSIVLDIGADSNTYEGAFYLDTMLYRSLAFNSQKIDTLRSAFTIGQSQVGIYTISDSGYVFSAGSLDVIGRILDVQAVDSVLAISTGKGVWLFRIYDDFSTEYRSRVTVSQDCYELLRLGNELGLFSGASLMRLNITDPFHFQEDTALSLPWAILQATQVGTLIFAVGLEGICVIDASGPTPTLLDAGGTGGYFIAAGNNEVAVSDSNSVNVFKLPQYPTPVEDNRPLMPKGFALGQNYPNPFNPATAISYDLPARAQVDLRVFNLLGQQVATLVDQTQAAGHYLVTWNGSDEGGRPLATGVYFYLLRAGNFAASKKMILLK